MKINLSNIKKAGKLLNKSECVAIPTETVYGLAGNAYSENAVKKIFRLKKRPKNNPLIIHYLNKEDAIRDVIINENFLKLYKRFCPGPLTFVLKKKINSKIKTLATANLNTVAIRFPSNKIVRSILELIDFPLSMPSANLSSGLSPVNAVDVFEEFKKRLNIIIDGGKSKIGIESTVIDLTEQPKVLRPGIISSSDIKTCLKFKLSKRKTKIRAPGMLRKHYSPGIPVIIGRKPIKSNHAYMVFGQNHKNKKNIFNLSKKGSLKEAASNLYRTMRVIKRAGFKKIYVKKIPNFGIGIAINDRLKRASKY